MLIAIIGPVANGPANAPLAQKAVDEFAKKGKIVNEKILTSTNFIIPTDKFRLGADNKIDTTISFDTGEWKGAFHLKGIVADTGTRVYSSHLDREFKFTDGQITLQSMEFSGDSLAWLGLMGDVASIKMMPTVVDADGKLTMTLTATDPFSKVRKLVFNDGQPLEIHYNDGVNATDSTCVVQFLNVERPLSGDVTFTLRLLKDFEAVGGSMVSPASPLVYPPNLGLWVPTEKGEKSWPQNVLTASVQDTVKFMLATGNGHGYDFKQMQIVQALNVDANEGYKYLDRKDTYFNWALNIYGSTRRVLKGALYELGMRDLTGKGDWTTGKGYGRPVIGVVPDSLNGLPVFMSSEDWGPKIIIGNPIGERYFFIPMMINSTREQWFIVKPSDGTPPYNSPTADAFSDADSVVGFKFKGGDNASKPYILKGGGTAVGSNDGVEGKFEHGDYKGDRPASKGGWTMTGTGTDTIMGSLRITVLDNRHIKIIDNNPVSWAGERYWMANGVLRPYDTATPVGVNEQPEIITPALSANPNPASDAVTIKINQPVMKGGLYVPTTLYLYTPLGVQVGEVRIPAGEQQVEVNLEALPTGIIWVTDKKHGLPLVIIR